MARRIVDGHKIYNKPWDSATRDVFFYCLTAYCDNYGLFPARPEVIGKHLGLDEFAVRDRLLMLEEAEVLASYSADGGEYYVFINWQDWQKMSYNSKPRSPLPPPDILEKLSEKTQKHLVKSSGGNSEKLGRAVAVAVAVANVGNANAFPSPAETDLPPSQWALRYYYFRLRQHTNLPKPVMPFGRAAGFLAEREAETDDSGHLLYDIHDFKDLVDEFFDHRIRGDKSSANWSLFESNWNALCIAVQKRRGIR